MNRNDSRFVAQKIRAQYIEKQSTELDELRRLDAKVKRPANVFSYIFGSIGAIIMGFGMSLVMTDIAEIIGLKGDPVVYGTVIGVVGLLMSVVNYPLYKNILNGRKKKYADQIMELSDKVVNGQ